MWETRMIATGDFPNATDIQKKKVFLNGIRRKSNWEMLGTGKRKE